MDVGQIKKLLEEAGLKQDGKWGNVKPKSGAVPRIVGEQADSLRKLESILESQLESDKAEVARLHSTLQKLKHGGGV
jgi:hypothetical protein